jgi:membrane protein required for colicin V production
MLTASSPAASSISAELGLGFGYHHAMQTLTPLDWTILAVLVLSTVMAFLHGFLVEVCALIGLVGGIVLAGQYYPHVLPWVQHFVHEYAAAAAIAFLLIAFGVMLAAAILGRVLRWILHGLGLGWADRLAGGAFGLLKGYILVALGVAAMAAFFPRQPWFDQSQLVPYFFPGAHGSATVLPRDLGVRIQSGLHSLEDAARREASEMGQHY